MSPRFAAAPWSTGLKVVSFGATIVIVLVFHFATRTLPNDPIGLTIKPIADLLPFFFFVPALLFIVSGYEMDRQKIRIRRLLWSTEFPMQGLSRVWHDPQAMRKSLRVWGNGGLYSISGVYQSRALGRYRAFVTDPESAVVLVLGNRTIVISPENPSAFVDYVRNLFPSAVGQ